MEIPKGSLSVETYCSEFRNDADYFDRLCEHTLLACFLPWVEEEASLWGGPWAEKYALCTLLDARIFPGLSPLKSAQQMVDEAIKRNELSLFNFPYRLTKDIEKIVIVGDQKCTRSKATGKEVEMLLAHMTEYEITTRQRSLLLQQAEIQQRRYTYPSLDHPFSVTICGNDDTSYSCCYALLESALAAIRDIIKIPKFITLERHGFRFTN